LSVSRAAKPFIVGLSAIAAADSGGSRSHGVGKFNGMEPEILSDGQIHPVKLIQIAADGQPIVDRVRLHLPQTSYLLLKVRNPV
jgi:hypothetical protein